ncbi:MAG: CDP-glycerol glycerophosphotransferase family protein [Lachnospiraceae bacterium]|nr:CDP-glycerol glycerophosphotransferase family protein [Lachnospiraceae bacterium]
MKLIDKYWNNEKFYILRRQIKAWIQSVLFYIFRIFPINKRKIVFCCIEGTTGYTCSPKYIAEEIIKQKLDYELVWLVNDTSKKFPKRIKVVKNTLLNRAYHLTTAKVWIENSRKQLEVRKRKGQVYFQTWHGKIGFKPIGLNRGASFSKIAYLVSKHDSEMIDYVITNSRWFEDDLQNGMLYKGPTLRIGSPRCDILLKNREKYIRNIRNRLHLPENAKLIMYAPTFRGGSQAVNRDVIASSDELNYMYLINTLTEKFDGEWYMLLRQHPQVVARNLNKKYISDKVIDVSQIDDMYEILAGCDAFLSDYSSAVFDAAIMKIPIFIFAYDYEDYKNERGKLMWDLNELPFPFGTNEQELYNKIKLFDYNEYVIELEKLFEKVELIEDGKASRRMIRELKKYLKQ